VTLAAVTLVVWSRPTPRVVVWRAVTLFVVIAVIESLGRVVRSHTVAFVTRSG
jgi:hypothetical protein